MSKQNQSSTVLGAAAALCLGGVAVSILRSFTQRRRRKDDAKHVIPDSLLASPLAQELIVAVDLALKAGGQMYPYCDEKGTIQELNHDLGIANKGQPEDFCTKVDVENERLIIAGLLEKFPTYKVIGEETTGTGDLPPLSDDPTWIIDPIDGTTNFASGLPLTCVSIGLCQKGCPVLGVVFAPMTNELYLAVAGGYGAFRNGVRITTRTEGKRRTREQPPQSTKRLVDSVVCFEFGYARNSEAIDTMVEAVRRLLEHGCRTTRSLGSGVLDLCYVATGRLDVVYTGVAGEGWKPWDYCAGMVVVEEAGCAIETLSGNEDFTVYSDSCICALDKSLAAEIRNVIRSS